MRKFADTQGTDKDGIQTLRPLYLYPLWILEGAGQLENLMTPGNKQSDGSKTETTLSSVDTRGSWPTSVSTTESTLILSGSSLDTRGSWPISPP